VVTIFSRGRDVLTVYPDAVATDGDGNRVRRPSASGVQVRGQFDYVASAEDTSAGDVTVTSARFFTDAWPTGYAGRVTFDGRSWDVDGEPQPHGGSRLTAHVVVRLRARAPRPVA
jgi:hypothetical protein